jgi:hypothetical protein
LGNPAPAPLSDPSGCVPPGAPVGADVGDLSKPSCEATRPLCKGDPELELWGTPAPAPGASVVGGAVEGAGASVVEGAGASVVEPDAGQAIGRRAATRPLSSDFKGEMGE